ncbi:hypothetical protein EES43_29410 [Streptomyces sp. ADI96-02]|nr:hypothetical protein EES43_29410 [Streptomyces sp. ADI96-02]
MRPVIERVSPVNGTDTPSSTYPRSADERFTGRR